MLTSQIESSSFRFLGLMVKPAEGLSRFGLTWLAVPSSPVTQSEGNLCQGIRAQLPQRPCGDENRQILKWIETAEYAAAGPQRPTCGPVISVWRILTSPE